LNSLRLFKNNLMGKIPLSFKNLIELEFLYIQENHFKGNVSNSISGLKKLKHFNFDSNQITD